MTGYRVQTYQGSIVDVTLTSCAVQIVRRAIESRRIWIAAEYRLTYRRDSVLSAIAAQDIVQMLQDRESDALVRVKQGFLV